MLYVMQDIVITSPKSYVLMKVTMFHPKLSLKPTPSPVDLVHQHFMHYLPTPWECSNIDLSMWNQALESTPSLVCSIHPCSKHAPTLSTHSTSTRSLALIITNARHYHYFIQKLWLMILIEFTTYHPESRTESTTSLDHWVQSHFKYALALSQNTNHEMRLLVWALNKFSWLFTLLRIWYYLLSWQSDPNPYMLIIVSIFV